MKKQSFALVLVLINLSCFVASSYSSRSQAAGDEFTANGAHRKVELFKNQSIIFEGQSIDCQKQEPLMVRDLLKARMSHREEEIAWAATDLANLYTKCDHLDKGEPYYQEALIALRTKFQDEHPGVAAALHNLGAYYELKGSNNDAAGYYERALKIWRKDASTPKILLSRELYDLADFYNRTGKTSLAEPLLRESIDVFSRIKEANAEANASILKGYAAALQTYSCLLEDQGRKKEASSIIKKEKLVRDQLETLSKRQSHR